MRVKKTAVKRGAYAVPRVVMSDADCYKLLQDFLTLQVLTVTLIAERVFVAKMSVVSLPLYLEGLEKI